MATDFEKFFDELRRRSEQISKNHDNEAIRHDLLIRPLLTNSLALGWDECEVNSQVNVSISPSLAESYYWRGAIPKRKRADIIIVPHNTGMPVAVVEEKKRQASLRNLEQHACQLYEYQLIHRVVWGLLTDGEKWILTKNHEIFHRFDGLSDLKHRFEDLKQCIGRSSLIDRLYRYGTSELVFVHPSPRILIMGLQGAPTPITDLIDFLQPPPSPQGLEVVRFLSKTLTKEIMRGLDAIQETDHSMLLAALLHEMNTPGAVLEGAGSILIEIENMGEEMRERHTQMYKRSLTRWFDIFSGLWINKDHVTGMKPPPAKLLLELYGRIGDYRILASCSTPFLKYAKELSISAPQNFLDFIERQLKERVPE